MSVIKLLTSVNELFIAVWGCFSFTENNTCCSENGAIGLYVRLKWDGLSVGPMASR